MHIDFCPKCFTITDGNFCHKCGFHIAAYEAESDILAPGSFIYSKDQSGMIYDKYKIGCKLGRGGFGITYTCQETKTGKRYAAKEYMPQTIAKRKTGGNIEPISPSDENAYMDGLNHFMEEANRLVDFAGQNNIVKLHSFVVSNNTGYIIMEYLDGINMKQKLKNVNTMDSGEALRMLFEVADCLRTVHSRGVIHGDISPENIMELYDVGHTIKLIDFGAAKSYVRNQRDDGIIFLKHGYAPPEQYSKNAQIGAWTDIYALAATYYKLVTGITPPRSDERKVKDTLVRLDKGFAGIDKPIADSIERAMSLDYRRRYMNMDDFVSDLKRTAVSTRRGLYGGDIENNNTDTAQENSPFGKLTPADRRRIERQKKIQERKEKRKGGVFGSSSREVEKNQKKVSKMNPYIKIRRNSTQLGIWNIRPGDEVSIGRESKYCGVVIHDEMISRVHCVVEYKESSSMFVFRDQSKNGVYSEKGTRLESMITYNFKVGTVLRLATDIFMELGGSYE